MAKDGSGRRGKAWKRFLKRFTRLWEKINRHRRLWGLEPRRWPGNERLQSLFRRGVR